jgi:acyl-CoA thioesterase-1
MTFYMTASMTKRFLFTMLLSCICSFSHAAGILVLGDSLSAGYGMDEKDGWAEQKDEQKRNISVINASISGETSGGANARLPKLLDLYQPDLVIVELGGNDGLRGYPVHTMEQQLQQIIDRSKAKEAEVLLLGMQIPPNYGKRYSRLLSAAYVNLAATNSLPFVPSFLETIATQPHLMQNDGIHPTAEAQPQILDTIWVYLKNLL